MIWGIKKSKNCEKSKKPPASSTNIALGSAVIETTYMVPVEFVLSLEEFYLSVNEKRLDKLKSFYDFPCKKASVLIAIAVWDDGAPGICMHVLISFINVRDRILNSAEQFLLFGADVDENSGMSQFFARN